MAATSVLPVQPIPRIHIPLAVDDLKRSNTTYNRLPQISLDITVNLNHIKSLLAILNKHGLHGKIGIHLLHKHDDLIEDEVKLEIKLKTAPGKWIKSAPITSLDLANIHSVVFRLRFKNVAEGLRPYFDAYEFSEGSSSISTSDLDSGCLEEAAEYINQNNIATGVAIEILDPANDGQPQESLAEFEVGNDTVLIPKTMANSIVFVPTGWPKAGQPFDPDGEPDPGTHWVPAKAGTKETHKVFVDQVESEQGLLDGLVRRGVINA